MASIIKTDNIQNTCGANIINQCGTTVTLGASGDSVVLGAGATASGFGRSGGVNYCTTAKTTPFTAANGSGYFVNTTCGAVTVTLPASPSAGAIIALKDYGGTWQTNNVTVCNNGSKINGVCATASLSTQGQSVTLIYVDATKGWQDINDSTSDVNSAEFVTATGGTVTTCGNFKIHTFTADGCFSVTNAGNPIGSNTVDYLVIAGGGAGGGNDHGGGGGAGGYRFSDGTASGCYTAGPAPLGASALPVSAQTYPITIGSGGSGGSNPTGWRGNSGNNSIFSTITSAGGGGGGSNGPCGPGPVAINGIPGGSGGGGAGISGGTPSPCGAGGTGNTPPTTPPQGNNGGNGNYAGGGPAGYPTGGGGGAGAVGANGSGTCAGDGGNGLASSITASSVTRGGGGGGSSYPAGTPGTGGTGGGGNGATVSGVTSGTANTGGGGGGLSQACSTPGGLGGSGVVIIRYKYQ
jgi:hypothetical protein